jgi:hypothetical protein
MNIKTYLTNMITKSYIERLKWYTDNLKIALDEKDQMKTEFACYSLFGYLESLNYFVEEEKGGGGAPGGIIKPLTPEQIKRHKEWISEKPLACTTCGRPLYIRKDGSLVCVEMTH